MAKLIIDKLFDTNKKFQREDFLEFVSEITWKYPSDTKKSQDKDWLYLRELLDIYEDKSWEKISIMIYKMPSSAKVEKARSYQRNLISNYLKNEWVFEWIDSVLCTFYSEDTSDWRLSFVKQEFKLNPETKKILNELTPAKRYSFLIESNSKNVTVKQRLNSLLESSNILVSDIEKAFSVEKVSKEFFDKYVKLYEKLVEAFKDDKVFLKIISESNNWDENFRENFVKKLLWQIVFLYFLQKKWWLWVPKGWNWWEWNKNFLQDLLKECLSWWDDKKELWWKNFFNDYLEHLFYANLNQKRENDYSEYFNCRIPYLNWWLFEPINNYHWKGFEYVVLAWDENNKIFETIFETFDEYNFTVYENDPLEQDVAVDPEMLGKVFENLLPENERKGKWAFYTPREIVHYMCKESLKNHIINKTWISEEKINWLFERKDSMYNSKKFGKELSPDERYNQFWDFIDYAESIVNTLKTVKIVDPAVWSGAFPMWLLKEIVSLRKYLQENILLEDSVSEYQIKKETLENCIYWVDLDPGAVEIAKLRFWLSLVIEEDSKDNIDPLPNLDYKIMQWNSLIEDIVVWNSVIKIDLENNTKKLTKKEEKEFSSISQWTMSLFSDEIERDNILKRLKFLHKVFFQEKDNNKKKNLKIEIDHIEKELIRISWEVEVNKLQAQIENIEWKYILSWAAWDEKDAKKVSEFYSQISSIKEMEEKYKRDNIRSFFPWKLHFWEVFNDYWGFDIVIWNPPYVSSWNMGEDSKDYYTKNYKTSVWHYDLYVLFFEIWIKLLSKKWNINYITSNKWLSQKYWTELRKLFLENKILEIVNFNFDVFETATVDSSILFLEKSHKKDNSIKVNDIKNKSDYSSFLKQEHIFINQEIFKDYEWFNFRLDISNNDLFIINKIKNKSIRLDDIAYISKWAELHSIKSLWVRKWDFIFDKKEGDNFKEYVEWKFFIKYRLNEKKYLNYSPNKHKAPIFPEFFESEKLIFKNIVWKLWIQWIYDIWWLYNNDALNNLILYFKLDWLNYSQVKNIENSKKILSKEFDYKYILWVIHSNLIKFYYDKLIWFWLHFYPSHLKQIPIKQIPQEEQKPFINLVNQILDITKNEDYLEREDLQKQVKVLESRIDDMVYKLYELTPEEIELVEESLK